MLVFALGISGSAAHAASGATNKSLPARPHLPTAMMGQVSQQRVLSYPRDEVWAAALRYLQVDRRYQISGRDAEAGVLFFSFPLGDELEADQGQGTIEMFETVDVAGRPSTKVEISTSAGPIHLPHALMDGLAAKLRAERGPPVQPPHTPAPPKKSPTPAPPPDAPPEPPTPPGPDDADLWTDPP